jgi:hypothetical protein
MTLLSLLGWTVFLMFMIARIDCCRGKSLISGHC